MHPFQSYKEKHCKVPSERKHKKYSQNVHTSTLIPNDCYSISLACYMNTQVESRKFTTVLQVKIMQSCLHVELLFIFVFFQGLLHNVLHKLIQHVQCRQKVWTHFPRLCRGHQVILPPNEATAAYCGVTAKTCGNFASKPRPRQAGKPRFCRDLMGPYFLPVLYIGVYAG